MRQTETIDNRYVWIRLTNTEHYWICFRRGCAIYQHFRMYLQILQYSVRDIFSYLSSSATIRLQGNDAEIPMDRQQASPRDSAHISTRLSILRFPRASPAHHMTVCSLSGSCPVSIAPGGVTSRVRNPLVLARPLNLIAGSPLAPPTLHSFTR